MKMTIGQRLTQVGYATAPVSALDALQRYAQERRDATLAKAQQLILGGRTPEEALRYLAHTLTNRILHAPSANLRAASLRGDKDLLRQAKELFEPTSHDADRNTEPTDD